MVFYRLQKSLWVELENYLKMKTRDNIPFTSINMPGNKKNYRIITIIHPHFSVYESYWRKIREIHSKLDICNKKQGDPS